MLWKNVALTSLIFLTGCSFLKTERAAPVIELTADSTISSDIHIVKPGQTLYEIAFEYGCDYRDLALANHIQAPYVIYPNQKLSLKKAKAPILKRKITPAKVSNTPLAKPSPTPPKMTPTKPNKAPMPSLQRFDNAWDWPVKGKIVKSYSLGYNLNKGIDIAGRLGEDVKAAASGNVVYSGSGLRGYGQLVIVKHNDTFLSAYAHNSQLLVKEGDVIKKGQVIAKMGRSDSDNIKLHFEIRKNGQPINPLTVLPRSPV